MFDALVVERPAPNCLTDEYEALTEGALLLLPSVSRIGDELPPDLGFEAGLLALRG
ncbi:hypothetical protein [Variovorax sp.]|uniref:hypothetical protein n=1 Tax=Variovorax sp. TaxID=1871043 RepID=UPI002D28091D|nr:hypothetical protein [Variovorax sp.]HYP82974.1 hypothetical protein [Variovorax sp.]